MADEKLECNEEISEENVEKEVKEPEQEEKTKSRKERKLEEKELSKVKKELEAKNKEYDKLVLDKNEINDKYLRLFAEFDNFKKRTSKEIESIYSSAYIDVIKELLPVFDNFERAAEYATDEQSKNGIQMIINNYKEVLKKLGVEEYGTVGDDFDANFHNAVMHAEDSELGENKIAEVFQKGYKKGDKVIRYAMVKVAN